jgi:hypothetical protein
MTGLLLYMYSLYIVIVICLSGAKTWIYHYLHLVLDVHKDVIVRHISS